MSARLHLWGERISVLVLKQNCTFSTLITLLNGCPIEEGPICYGVSILRTVCYHAVLYLPEPKFTTHNNVYVVVILTGWIHCVLQSVLMPEGNYEHDIYPNYTENLAA